jgi:hypothetical protein
MSRLRRRVGGYHITVLGWVLVVIVPGAFLLAFLGPAAVQAPALVVGILAALAVAAEGGALPRFGGFVGSSARRANVETQTLDATEADSDAWRRERERREADEIRGALDGRKREDGKPNPFGDPH